MALVHEAPVGVTGTACEAGEADAVRTAGHAEAPFVDVPCMRCDARFELRAGEHRVTVISYAAAAGSHIFVSPENVVNLSCGYLQTRGFIDTGSSGGPVINEAGDIVAIVSRTGTRATSGTADLAKTRLISLLRPQHFGM